jgi:hypothetical protein
MKEFELRLAVLTRLATKVLRQLQKGTVRSLGNKRKTIGN